MDSRMARQKCAGAALILCLSLMITFSLVACRNSKEREIERITSETRQNILSKLKKGQQISASDIDSLVQILIMKGNFDQGISILNSLEHMASYKDVQYDIHFGLALLNIEKATSKKESNGELITAFQNNLNRAFKETPDKALAFYRRGNIYSEIGCITKANRDFQEAITLAGSGNLIFWGDGIYLKKETFVNMVNKQLSPNAKDDCILEHRNK
jgi:tetratricopeptide (TPR) repeat protein